MRYLLDSCALIAYFLGEKEGEVVKNILNDSNNSFYLNYVNYGEILFSLGKKGYNLDLLEEIQENLKFYLRIHFISTDDFKIVELAAKYKIDGGLSYFDALILANSQAENLTILTKDSEFEKFTKDFKIQILK
jgi:predicted nucleic acid-binding protein